MSIAHLGDTEKALASYGQAITLFSNHEQFNVAFTLRHMAVYWETGDRLKALESNEKALQLFRDSAFFEGEASTLMDMGQIYDELGERRKALDKLTQALSKFSGDDLRRKILTLNSLGGRLAGRATIADKRNAMGFAILLGAVHIAGNGSRFEPRS